MCKGCVVETGFVPGLERDLEQYLVDWWPGSRSLSCEDWYGTKERLAGFGEALVIVGAVQAGRDVLMLSEMCGQRYRVLSRAGESDSGEFWPRLAGQSIYSLYTRPLRAVRF